jgi:hypothetical protein
MPQIRQYCPRFNGHLGDLRPVANPAPVRYRRDPSASPQRFCALRSFPETRLIANLANIGRTS